MNVLTAPATATFQTWSTRVEVHATDATSLAAALTFTRGYLDRLDRAASRFREDSEVNRLAVRAARGPVTASISTMLREHLAAALRAAELTDGLVDPTVGASVRASGYDADIDVVRAREESVALPAARVPGWRTVELDDDACQVTVAAGTLLDLGATAKAHAADDLATRLAMLLPGGFLLNLGGDIAVAGSIPEGGWRIGVEAADDPTSSVQTIVSTGTAVATSSTRRRRWRTSTGERHHVVDPRTGTTAATPWAQVSTLAPTALEANAWSTAALVLGDDAPGWLFDRRIGARLERPNHSTLTTPEWPDPTPGVTW